MMRIISSILIGVLILGLSFGMAQAKGQDIVKINADILIPKDATVNNVVAVGGTVTIDGRVENNVVAVGGTVTLNAGAYVGEQIVSVGGDVIKDPLSMVKGKITQVYMPHFIPSFSNFLKGGWMMLWATISILALFGFLGLAILLYALIPDNMGAVVRLLEKSFVPSMLWGMFWMILIVPVAILLAISIVGIVLIPLEVLLAVLALVIGYIASGVFIGKNVLTSFAKKPIPFVDAVVGILILFLIGFVPLVGPIIKILFVTAGFGAVITTRFGTVK